MASQMVKIPRTPKTIETDQGTVHVFGPVSPAEIMQYSISEGLSAFRRPVEQQQALAEIADLPEGQICLAVCNQCIVGYITFHPPEEFERWHPSKVPSVLEMGAIETSKDWRKYGIGRALLQVGYGDGSVDDYIVIATEYYWHWDLKDSGLSIWQYQKMLENVFKSIGLRRVGTDEQDILAHPANMLMARVGSRVPTDTVILFEESLFLDHMMF
ncbi:GNAT family N-acetyltransferase [Heliophilum fasciatum]|uniref:Acetoin utilization protein AcuA n=1 Tax=Heliophilum fasciatum TaxID=35700 RepID=A0A4R2RWF8_9FIRM|nr:GNAT family N-acetyltransferase [Heliophilum fasciatum]MCW2278510.1 acetoin utilization protein AcuA [Heliophilum fasciatum]TCP63465.1 acetoin utilization protein AcuA [Heliophilum fasciatum]